MEAEHEADLIRQAQRGSVSAFNELVLRYEALLFNVALRILGDAAAAAEAAQEAFLSAFTHITDFHGGSFKHWLLRIVTNACYNALRYTQRRPALSLDQPLGEDSAETLGDVTPAPGETPEEVALRHDLGRLIAQAVLALPVEQRVVLVLCDVHGFSYEDVAEITRTALGTVKSRLSRARAKLRDKLLAEAELLESGMRLEHERGDANSV